MQLNMFKRCLGVILSGIVLLTAIFMPTYSFATDTSDGSTGKTLTKDYYFEMENETDFSFQPEEFIKVDGKKYKFKSVDYEYVSKPITEKIKVVSKSKKAKPYIYKTAYNTEIKLYAPSKIKWEKIGTATLQREYGVNEAIPETITNDDGKTLYKQNVVPGTRKVNVSAPAVFATSNKSSPYYMFNGEVVCIDGNTPTWDGCLKDYADYLGVTNNHIYDVTGAYWDSEFKKQGDKYVRTATITGTKIVNYNTVSYGESLDAKESWEAAIKYTSKYIGVAHVKYRKCLSTIQKIILAGAGIFLLAGLITLILFWLKRKKNEEEELSEEEEKERYFSQRNLSDG